MDYIYTIAEEIAIISDYDEMSDYFRYASGKIPNTKDLEKQTIRSVPLSDITKINYEKPTMYNIIVDAYYEPTKMYKAEENKLEDVKEKLIKVSCILENFNLQIRHVFEMRL